MDQDMIPEAGTVSEARVSLLERIALLAVRLVALPFLILGLVLWGLIMLLGVIVHGILPRRTHLAEGRNVESYAERPLATATKVSSPRTLFHRLHIAKRR